VILVNGYDGTAEELYFTNGAAALERGYDVLAFDGPGQGAMIIDHGVPFRPDWENVITPWSTSCWSGRTSTRTGSR
jgi:alpha-beta hydrolase superfamily lysophospholipase